MHSRSLLLILCFFVLSGCHLGPLKAKATKIVPAFVGGLNVKDIRTCSRKIKGQCPTPESKMDRNFIDCVERQMIQQKTCNQNLSLFILERNFFNKIKRYPGVDVVRTSAITSDEPIRYFMVDHQGELIDPFVLTDHIDITTDISYPTLIQQFPQAELSGFMLDFPFMQRLSDKQIRLTFKQKLLNGHRTGEELGTADIAYDFDHKGKFLEATLLQLVLNKKAKKIQS